MSAGQSSHTCCVINDVIFPNLRNFWEADGIVPTVIPQRISKSTVLWQPYLVPTFIGETFSPFLEVFLNWFALIAAMSGDTLKVIFSFPLGKYSYSERTPLNVPL